MFRVVGFPRLFRFAVLLRRLTVLFVRHFFRLFVALFLEVRLLVFFDLFLPDVFLVLLFGWLWRLLLLFLFFIHVGWFISAYTYSLIFGVVPS